MDSIGPDGGAEIDDPWLTLRRADWSEERVERLRAFLARVPDARVEAIEGADHDTFDDLPIVQPAQFGTEMDARRGHREVADRVLRFLDAHLRR